MKGIYLLFTCIISLFVTILSQNLDMSKEIHMDWQEKDKILSCTEIVSRKFQKDQQIIEKLIGSTNIPKEQFSNKVSAEMLAACYNRIDENTVRGMFQNLTVIDIDWHDSYDSLVEIDYSKFKPVSGQVDLEYTPDQHILFYKLDKAREEFISVSKVRQSLASQTVTIFGVDISKISGEIKTLYLLAVFAAFIFGTLYLLNKLKKANEKSKKKKRN